MIFCANCDNDAIVVLMITEQGKQEPYPLPMCATCKDAFDWGTTHAQDSIEEQDVEPTGEEEEVIL